ncbi:FdtA/QdtA family cupin domain-containing protein [Flavobacterium sp.]|uniref:sugar 3,4-ketoisomerase n=1 Tax=Flavobacterium sp. TaxID=239 RepID=UPI00286A33B1|nr:FdtA/QdtA family cupin domain-containing protein [Flavobacterium sp.]
METMQDFTKPHIINLPKIMDVRGNLSFLQNQDQIPFDIQRVFWIYDVPGGETRGGHAYKTQQEIIIVISGSIDIIVVDAQGNQTKFSLNRSYSGLYIPPMHWRHLENFSTNSVSVHLSSSDFSEADYIRNYNEFIVK